MSKKIILLLAGVIFSLVNFTNISEANSNTGLTEAQMEGIISVLADKVGKTEADNASEVLGKVLSSKAKR